MFSIFCGYPARADEEAVVRTTTTNHVPKVNPVLDGPKLLELQRVVRAVPVSDEVIRFAVKLVAMTRPEDPDSPAFVKEFVRCGAGPRASQYLVLGAKGRAALAGQPCADFDGVRAVAKLVLGHRVIPNFNARAQKMTSAAIVDQILSTMKK
jgi:MoxR-like ATPase